MFATGGALICCSYPTSLPASSFFCVCREHRRRVPCATSPEQEKTHQKRIFGAAAVCRGLIKILVILCYVLCPIDTHTHQCCNLTISNICISPCEHCGRDDSRACGQEEGILITQRRLPLLIGGVKLEVVFNQMTSD